MENKELLIGNTDKLKELKWWDILILTIIMLGDSIYISTISFMNSSEAVSTFESIETIDTDNYSMLIKQGVVLIIVLGYLRFRNFDFSQWKVKINLKTTLMGIVLFIVLAVAMDIFVTGATWIQSLFVTMPESATSTDYAEVSIFAMFNLSTVLYAILNGVYEEIYFLGICLFVKRSKLKYAFLFSLLIRFSFHTYQGLIPPIGFVLVLGIPYYLIYTKTNRKNLYPIFLSHAIADVLGLGILSYLPLL